MDTYFYISIYNSISKTIWILLLTTILLEGYLVQRCFQVNSNIQEKIIDLDNPNSADDPLTLGRIIGNELGAIQQEPMGFKVNYGTLSLLWPVILFAFFLALNYALWKRLEVLKELKTDNLDFKLSRLRLDLFSLFFSKKRDLNLFIILLLFILPIIGLLFHAYSGYYMVNLIEDTTLNAVDITPESKKIISQLNTLFQAQVIISSLFLIFVLFVNVKSAVNYLLSNKMVLPKKEVI